MSEGSVQWSVGKSTKVDPLANEILLRGISVSPRHLKLNVGDSYKLNVDLIPKNATFGTIEWFACDFNYVTLKPKIGIESDVVKLDSRGKVTAMLLGQARITARIFIESRSFSAGIELCRVMVIEKTDVPPGTITVDGFGGWYNPSDVNTGVKHRVPRFVQIGAGPCFGYCEMMGDYYLRYRNVDINDFFANRRGTTNGRFNKYLDDDDRAQWVNTVVEKKNFSDFNELKTVLIRELDLGKPVIVSRRTNRTDGGTNYNHAALVVAYKGNGAEEKDFILIDPLRSQDFPTTYAEFRRKFPSNTTGLDYVNLTRTFVKPEKV